MATSNFIIKPPYYHVIHVPVDATLVRSPYGDLVRESASCSVTKSSEASDAATAAYMLSYTRPSGRDR